jgi:hypothetical protein
MTDSMSHYDKVNYAITEICKNDRNLREKQFLLTYALQNVSSVRGVE